MAVHRCQHLKTNGRQCGSPALRAEKFCYFHRRWKGCYALINDARTDPVPAELIFPVLEDYESIQMAIMQVLQKLPTGHLNSKTAGLLLYGLQIASSNLRHAHFEPYHAESVVIDLEKVPHTPLDADQWDREDEEEEENEEAENEEAENEEVQDETTARPVETELSPVSADATKEGEQPNHIQAAAEEPEPEEPEPEEPEPKIKPSPKKAQPAISDADFLRALAGLADHLENGTPLKFPVYPRRPPATARSGTNGHRRNGNGGS